MAKRFTPERVAYLSAERHPSDLVDLIFSHLHRDEFIVSRVCYEDDADRIAEVICGADLMFCAPGRLIDPRVIRRAKRLRHIQLWSSGYDKFDIKTPGLVGISVSNNGGANRIAVAEHTLMLMLAVYKRLPENHHRATSGNWSGNSHGMDSFLLFRKTLGIIGLGAIGKEVAVRARAFGMRVLYFDTVRRSASEEDSLGIEFASFEQILSVSDFISPHLHLSDSTSGLIGEQEIGSMKSGAVVINVSRAELVDNDALFRALNEGRLGGAAFDVYESEPTQANDPLLLHPAVVCTPHSANTRDTHIMAMNASVENLLRVHRGIKPKWVVNEFANQ